MNSSLIDRKKLFTWMVLVGALSQVHSVGAAPKQWTAAAGGNDHYYDLIWGPNGSGHHLSWPNAKAYAESLSYQGLPGRLAVVPTQELWDFILAEIPRGSVTPNGAWLGGYQDTDAPDYSEPNGGWRWIDGTPWSFTAWGNSEPNDIFGHGSENYLEGVWWGWNDNDQTRRLYVEYYQPVAAVPEPSSIVILLTGTLGWGCCAALRRSRRRRPMYSDQERHVKFSTKSGVLLILLLGLFGSSGSAMAAGSLIVNGSFEDNPGPIPPYEFRANKTTVEGWEVISGNVDLVRHYWDASDGIHSIDLIGNTWGTIQQSFATEPNRDFVVFFDMAANPEHAGPGLQSLRVSAAGSSSIFSFDPTGRSFTNMGWTEMSWTFTANAPTTTLSFESVSPWGADGPALDNVRVMMVPELSSGSLAAAGLLCGLLFRKRLGRQLRLRTSKSP